MFCFVLFLSFAVTIEFVSLGLGEPSSYEKLLHSTSEILLEVHGSEWLNLVPHVAKLIYQLNTLCVISQINKAKDLAEEETVDFKLLERESVQLVSKCCSFIVRISPPEDARKNLRALRPVILELLTSYSDRMNLSEIARPLIEYAFAFKRSETEVPTLFFVFLCLCVCLRLTAFCIPLCTACVLGARFCL